MPPATQFKNWETQARLLAAAMASMDPFPRLDYKKIALYYGNGATESAMEHRFRAVKIQAELVKIIANEGLDPGRREYRVHDCKSRDEMQKFFGASTPEGLAFQFRAIKQGVKVLQDAVATGEDPVAAFSNSLGSGASASVPGTPTARTPSSTKRARSTKKATPGGATPASKRRKAIKVEDELNDEGSPDADYDDLDTTPTKPRKQPRQTPKNAGQPLPKAAWAKPAPSPTPATGTFRTPTVTFSPAATTFTGTTANDTIFGTHTAATRSPGMGHTSTLPHINGLSGIAPSYVDPVLAYQTPAMTSQYPPPPPVYMSNMLDSASPSAGTVSGVNTPKTAASYSSTTTGTLTGGRGRTPANGTAANGVSFKTETETNSFSHAYSAHGSYSAFANEEDDIYNSSYGDFGGGQHNGHHDDVWGDGDAGDI